MCLQRRITEDIDTRINKLIQRDIVFVRPKCFVIRNYSYFCGNVKKSIIAYVQKSNHKQKYLTFTFLYNLKTF